jgi:hypothetical protein
MDRVRVKRDLRGAPFDERPQVKDYSEVSRTVPNLVTA